MITDKDISVVVAGTVYPEMTDKCFDSIRKIMPNAEVIFSTWKDVDCQKIDCDRIVYNDDPGNFKILDHDKTVLSNNMNRQIVSTVNGISAASRKYVLKLRSDTLVKSRLNFDIINKYTKYNEQNHFLNRRVACVKPGLEKNGRRYTFAMCDWYFFGEKNDLMKLWNIPLISKETFFYGPKEKDLFSYDYNMHEENYLMCNFALKDISFDYFNDEIEELCDMYRKILVNNFIVVSMKKFGCCSQKYPRRLIEEINLSKYIYGENDWIKIYKQELDKNVHYNIMDEIWLYRKMHRWMPFFERICRLI